MSLLLGTSNWYFPVYVDQARPKNYGYCAWHYGGKCAGTTIQFGFFWGGLDYDASCQVGSGGLSTTITGNGTSSHSLHMLSVLPLRSAHSHDLIFIRPRIPIVNTHPADTLSSPTLTLYLNPNPAGGFTYTQGLNSFIHITSLLYILLVLLTLALTPNP